MEDVTSFWEKIEEVLDRILAFLPPPWNSLAKWVLIIFIVVSLATFLMKLWQKLKPKKGYHEINKVTGQHASTIKRDAKGLEKSGNFLAAGDSYKALGKDAKAIEMYKKASAFDRVGEIMIEKGKVKEALDMWEQTGNHMFAAKYLAKDGQYERAAQNFLRANNASQAAEMFEKAQSFDKAGEQYAKAGNWLKAAANYQKANLTVYAAKAYEKYFLEQVPNIASSTPDRANSIKDVAKRAAVLYQKANKPEEAAELYIKAGFHAEAAKILEELGQHDRAAKLYEESGRKDQAARLLMGSNESHAQALQAEAFRNEGKYREAAALYVKMQDYLQAAEMFASSDMNKEAAECFMKGGAYADAAALYIKSGAQQQAGVAYFQARDFNSALAIFDKIGDIESAIKTLIADGRPVEAAARLINQRRVNEAYQILQQIQPDHEQFSDACLQMARVHAQSNRADAAIQLLQKGIKGQPVNDKNVEMYYMQARLFEQRRDFQLATDIYSRILAFDISYKDAAVRHQQIRDQMAYTAPAPMGAAVDPGATAVLSGGAKTNPKFKIIDELGRGGMGVVYKAEDTKIGRIVAYKVLPPDLKNHPKLIESFEKEFRALGALHHPNIVTIFEAGDINKEYYFVMEFVEGKNLKEIIRDNGALPLKEMIRISIDLADALNYAHNLKIAHRDIKSANVMISKEGRVKLMDFGLAKVMGEVGSERTAVSGTPYYMSPEQTVGQGVDHRTDIYSLGAMMYELATGQVPFKEGNVAYHHVNTKPAPPSSLRPEIPPALDAIILKCLEKKKEARYQTAGDIVTDLRNVAIA